MPLKPAFSKRTKVVLALFGACLLAGIAYSRTARDQELDAIRAAGLPATGAELNDWYRHLDPRTNAAVIVAAAAKLHLDDPVIRQARNKPSLDPREIDAHVVREYLKLNLAAVEKLRDLLAYPHARYAVDFSRNPTGPDAPDFSHLHEVRSLCFLLKLEAFARAQTGNPHAAAEALKSGLALANTLRDEPSVMSSLGRLSAINMQLDALKALINLHTLSEQELEQFERILHKIESDSRANLFRAYVGERVSGFTILACYLEQSKKFTSDELPWGPQNVRALKARASGRDRTERDLFLRAMAEYLSVATNGFPEIIRAAHASERNPDDGPRRSFSLATMVLPSLVKPVEKLVVLTAELRCARAALAIERYRVRNGRLPDSLEDVRLAGSPLTDPATGQPLVWRTLESGYVIEAPGSANLGKKPSGRSIEVRVLR